MTTTWEQVTNTAKLISLPDIYLQLKAVLDNPDYAMTDVAVVISHDPALTARLLRLVNSSYFGLATRIDTVSHAINMLGTQQVHDLVLATSVAETFKDMSSDVMDMRLFWSHSVCCAVTARMLAYACNVLDSERLFVAGLLADIGHLVMYQSIPDLSQQSIARAEKNGRPLYLVERSLIGLDYARVGGALMRRWGLPKSLWESTEFHVEPGRATEYPIQTAIIHIATTLTAAAESSEEPDARMSEVDTTAWDVTELTPEQCIAVQKEVGRKVDSVINLFFPPKRAAHA